MKRILIIDDNPHVLHAIEKLLKHAGYEVTIVKSSDEGIAMHKERAFDLIITDIVLPEKEGISTIIELKSINPDLKIIAMSGGGSFEPYGYLDIAKRVGADLTIAKPFMAGELLEGIKRLISEI